MRTHNFRAPWRRVGGLVVDAEGNAVAARYSWRRFESDERGTITPCDADANCQALSAVPDLIAACEALLSELAVLGLVGTEAANAGKQALAKARGKEG